MLGHRVHLNSKFWLATVAELLTMQNFKVNSKNLFLFFLVVIFCCDVGDSDCVLKARCLSHVFYIKSAVLLVDIDSLHFLTG